MAAYNEVVELFDEMAKMAIDTLLEFDVADKREKFSVLDSMEEDIERFKEIGVLRFGTYNHTASEVVNEAGNSADTLEGTQGPKRRGRTKQRTNAAGRSSSSKENSREGSREPSRATRRRKAFMEASQIINNDPAITTTVQDVVVKVERLTDEFINNHNTEIANMPIKKEKTDMPPPARPPIRQTRKKKGTHNKDTTNLIVDNIQVKKEQIESESRKQKLVTESVTAQKHSSISRDSNVQVIPEHIDTINLINSDEEETERSLRGRGRPKTKQKQQKKDTSDTAEENSCELSHTVRVTRTKTRNTVKKKGTENEQSFVVANQKRQHESSTEEDTKEKSVKRTKPKKLKNKKNELNNISLYEDAVSNVETPEQDHVALDNGQANTSDQMMTIANGDQHKHPQIINETILINKYAALNETVIIEKPNNPVAMNKTVVVKKVPNGNQLLNSDLMTEDEDDDAIINSVKPQTSHKLKQVFSPYANSPVKKRVEAFEKLGAEANAEVPLRMTRTKTKAKELENASNETSTNIPIFSKHGAIPKLQRTPVVEHTTLTTPVTCDKYKIKGYDHNLSGINNISLMAKSKSALKASQAEFRERELKRKQKEVEALSKKEALIQQQIEEKRRKREEKLLKVQQTRDAMEKMEKDKQRMLEDAERIKQEKIKQMMAEKEEKLLKQKEEAARKRALALKKATEEKQKEEEKKRQELAKIDKKEMQGKSGKKQLPPYLKYETPLLPTEDCYDSDDSNASKPFSVPSWQKKEILLKMLRYMRYVNTQKKQLFCSGPKTVDLQEIFPSIEPHKLKRTSSAIWNKSGLAKLPTMAEEDENTS